MMNRVSRGRVPLGQRSVNVDHNGGGNGGGKGTIGPLSKRDSRSNLQQLMERKPSSGPDSVAGSAAGSELSSTCPSTGPSSATTGHSSGGGPNNKAFTSLNSEALRRALASASTMASLDGGNGGGSGGGGGEKKPKQPLGTRRPDQNRQNVQNQQPPQQKPGALPVAKPEKPRASSSSAEPVTIVEHRKRPCGEGYTVHKYLRGKLLGKGGFAKVYKVTSLDTNKEYAVKIVPKANLVKSRARQKLQTEIKIHRTMRHANVCEYKHFFEDKTNCYILLELCHNQSMNEMIKRRKHLTEEETRLLMIQIVDAVGFMHDSNVIHRDLKLGNLFLSRSMNVKVGDFGLACRVDSTDEKRKTICGTPNYIAPEVIEGNKEKRGHSFEVDVWSMGVICFAMLVGKPPYESRDVKSTYRRILANEYSFPQGKVGDDARALISSMLQTDPKMRPSLEDIRQHPFFTLHQIPGSLPQSCTVSAPIWSTDEFGELYAVKPTSALDVHVRKPAGGRATAATATATASSSAGVNSGHRRIEGGILKNGGGGGDRAGAGAGGLKKAASKSSGTAGAGAFDIYDDANDQVEFKLDSRCNAVVASDAVEVKREEPTAAQPAVGRLTDRMAACGFDDDEARDMPPPGSSCEPPEPATAATPASGTASAADLERELALSPPTASSSRSGAFATTPNNDDHNELVTMHARLEECLDNYERIQNGAPKVECPLRGGEVWGANKWVTRYVDYTSKYGLGFLLNDGSSGVYFNDSTKAVHAASGENFVYVERRKTGAGGVVREPVSLYTLTGYPEDTLKKKVTLLQHFRSYLLDQQKRAEEVGEAEPLSSNFEEQRDPPSASETDDGAALAPMVFMKKWIKTKHAMLFRLSNGTVQVLFYDATEVLISSEGNLITFVDKDKNRFVHSIAEIANKQHGDVSRRLKYAKEILAQLITASSKRG